MNRVGSPSYLALMMCSYFNRRSLEIAVESCINILHSTQVSSDTIISERTSEYEMVGLILDIGDVLAP